MQDLFFKQGLRKIGAYLKLEEDTIFSIPEYQRPYSWQIVQCDKLWQDIVDYIDSGIKDSYFFGTIIINCQNNDEIFSLIDGQQRTTSFLLLLKALLICINIAIGKTSQDDDSEILFRGLTERRRKIMGILYKAEIENIPNTPDFNTDRSICSHDVIIENHSINELYKTELQNILSSVDFVEAESRVTKIPRKQKDNKYTNFFRNFKFFYEKAKELSESQLNLFAKTLTDRCEVIEIKSWQIEQAITMFNSLNSDGLPLYDADIISAKLYAKAEKYKVSEDFTKLWKTLIELIDDLKQTGIANIDSIFMQQMYYERAKGNEIVSDSGCAGALFLLFFMISRIYYFCNIYHVWIDVFIQPCFHSMPFRAYSSQALRILPSRAFLICSAKHPLLPVLQVLRWLSPRLSFSRKDHAYALPVPKSCLLSNRALCL